MGLRGAVRDAFGRSEQDGNPIHPQKLCKRLLRVAFDTATNIREACWSIIPGKGDLCINSDGSILGADVLDLADGRLVPYWRKLGVETGVAGRWLGECLFDHSK